MDGFVSFSATVALLALAPGPDNLYVITQSSIKGARTGIAITLGLCTGLVVYSLLAALGLTVILWTSPLVFTALKILGTGYLLLLAYKGWTAKPQRIQPSRVEGGGLGSAYLRGILMNLSNPKIAIFFLAFLPQFITADGGSIAGQMLILSVLFIAISILIFSSLALVAGHLQAYVTKSDRLQIALNRTAAVVLAALAIKLATFQPESN